MLSFLSRLFGTAQSRRLAVFQKIAVGVNREEEAMEEMGQEGLRARVVALRHRAQAGESLDALLPEAYAVVKRACRHLVGKAIHVSGYDQEWDMIPYDTQIVGAVALHHGSIAEMPTGEGKTLTASMPLFLNTLKGDPVHLVTVNDYLADRDCQWVGEIFRYLGLHVMALTQATPPEQRRKAYEADILYGTASELGFDYLRDHSMVRVKEGQVQRGHGFVIIDEVDSILIDEARTPLIISGPVPNANNYYEDLKEPVRQAVKRQKEHCQAMAIEAENQLKAQGAFSEEKHTITKEGKEALRALWIVSNGMPKHPVIKRVKEHPDLRAGLESWTTFFFGEANKAEKEKALSELLITIDERGNSFELTEKGMSLWCDQLSGSEEDFLLLDLGEAYGQVDADPSLSDQERQEKKGKLREEDRMRKERSHNLHQLFRAHLLFEKDVEYIIAEGRIVIIDMNTGRPQPGRRFSEGLHQALEAKEGLKIQQETQTYASTTLQNYFRLYSRLAGMTGTAMTEAQEFKEIYGVEVVAIPPHRPCQRIDHNDEVYMTEREKYQALLKEVEAIHKEGRPILIGTESVDFSEKVARLLKERGLKAQVLNAKNPAQEAEIIARAGAKGQITVATNMAGRGTDIKLGEGVAERGGLYVMGTSRHPSRRIDKQLQGRCGRQGDPGDSKFYISFEDHLLRLFSSPKMSYLLKKWRPPEGEPIVAKMVNHSIETAQKRVEARNYSVRKHTLEYDDVINEQRKEVYAFRQKCLDHQDMLALAEAQIVAICQRVVAEHRQLEERQAALSLILPILWEGTEMTEEEIQKKGIMTLKEHVENQKRILLQAGHCLPRPPEDMIQQVMGSLFLSLLDSQWQQHLHRIDHLRSEVSLRAMGQKDPLIEFKEESFALFKEFSSRLQNEMGNCLFRFTFVPPEPSPSKV
ncbi:MAG: preprotein translocase subunit SecA [Chlamydiota bacterium]|nr:preprotein translocase subunit SecA [Chlamydiota bacterium]